MRRWHRHITLAFGLVFLLSGGVNAYAKAYMAGANSIFICAGPGNDSVTLGVNGEALPELHLCEICCIAVALPADAMPVSERESRVEPVAYQAAQSPYISQFITPSRLPRGPPARG